MRPSVFRNGSTLLFSLACTLFATGAPAQLTTTVDSEVKFATQLIDQIEFGNQVLSASDPASTQEELPGLGHKFELLGVMVRDTDPENSAGNSGASGGGVGGNEGISATMTATSIALALRNTPSGVKIGAFTNQLGFKYFFVGRSCGGGSPRLSLLVDTNGDGQFVQGTDFAAHGHVNAPTFAGCPPNMWKYEDLTDKLKRWEVTPATAVTPPCGPIGGVTTCTWDELKTRITAQYPNHKILAGFLVEDSCSFFALACGKAHYDLLTIENRTLEIWQDTVQNH